MRDILRRTADNFFNFLCFKFFLLECSFPMLLIFPDVRNWSHLWRIY